MGFDLTMRVEPASLPTAWPAELADHPAWYRLRPHAMAVMVAILRELGVLVDLDAPPFPSWPPNGLSAERAEEIDEGADATPDERASQRGVASSV